MSGMDNNESSVIQWNLYYRVIMDAWVKFSLEQSFLVNIFIESHNRVVAFLHSLFLMVYAYMAQKKNSNLYKS